MLRCCLKFASPYLRRSGGGGGGGSGGVGPCPRYLSISEFWDANRNITEPSNAGRAWRASELRLKSTEDLHKLWYVLVKELNLLRTERTWCNRARFIFRNPERIVKVKQGMARIKTVLTQRAAEEQNSTNKRILLHMVR